MPKVPSYRRQRLPSTNVGAAPLPVGAANVAGGAIGQGLQALGAGVGRLGQSLQIMKARDDKNKDSIASKELENTAKAEEEKYKLKIAGDGDVNNWEGYRKEADDNVKARASELNWGTSDAQERAGVGLSGWSTSFKASNELAVMIKNRDEAIKTTGEAFLADPSPENEAIYRDPLEQRYGPDLVDDIIDETRAKGLEAIRKNTIDSTKPAIEQVLIANDFQMKPANEAIDAIVGKMQSEGLLNATEAAEARQDLTNWAADTAAQRRKAEKENIIQTWSGFADDLANGTFTGDNVALSNLTATQKKELKPVIVGARKEPPTESTLSGSNTVVKTLTDYATRKVGELEAIKTIIKTRYEDGAITDDYYRFAIGRIKDKYPVDVAETIAGATRAAESVLKHEGIGIIGIDWVDKKERQKLSEVTQGLLSWVEGEAKDGKYPSGEAIYKKTRELGVSVKTPDDIDREVPRMVPKRTDPLYDPNDAEVDAMDSGTDWYDPVTGRWWKKK